MADLPIVLNSSGLVPASPASLQQQLLALVASTNPDYTGNLPGTLIEDIASTDVGALIIINQALVELINSISPLGANAFLLSQIGQQVGVPIGLSSNTSAYVIFTGKPGFVIGAGFLVSDGTFQYAVVDGGIIGSDGQTPQLFALATQTGTWAVPPNTITQLVTSVPTGFTLTVANPTAGTPGTGAEDETSYRARVLQAQLASAQGMLRFLRTLLGNVSGVQQRLIAAIKESGSWEVIVGGGDPYQVAYAIYIALGPGIPLLVGSTLSVLGITQADPAVVTTDLNHLYSPGQVVEIAGVDPSTYDGTYTILATPTEKTFSLGVPFAAQNLSALSWAATGGGQLTATTSGAHGVTAGSTFSIAGSVGSVVANGYNGTFVALSVTTNTIVAALVVDPGTATTLGALQAGVANFDSTGLSAWVSGGVVTPNLRNISVTITDYPDTYLIPFVNPPQQVVTMTATWDTTSPNFVSEAAVAQLAVPALVDYINSIAVGQPINVLDLESTFRTSIVNILQPSLVTRLVFSVSINGVGTPPSAGTETIFGDPESYFFAQATGISVVQG